MLIGIQGQAGSFHEYVAKQWYGDSAEIAYFTSFANLFDAYEASDIDAVVAAVENTLYGSINDVYQLVELCPQKSMWATKSIMTIRMPYSLAVLLAT